MNVNVWALVISTIIPLALGMIWYNPKIGFGKAWIAASGITDEKIKNANLPLMFTLTAVCAFFVAFAIQSLVIHQFAVMGILTSQPDSADPNGPSATMFKEFMSRYGTSYRTFKHGAFHGTIAGITLVLPIIATNALYEAKGAKYIFINAGYWTLSLALMGGVTCAMI